MSSMNVPDFINLLLLKFLVVAEGYVNDPVALCVCVMRSTVTLNYPLTLTLKIQFRFIVISLNETISDYVC